MHFAAGRNAVALTNRNGQGAKHQPGGLFRQRIGKIGGLRRDPCLQAWVSASSPVWAVMVGGTLTTSVGSMIAMSGQSASWNSGYLILFPGR